ncbi:hypothetical protein I4U23_003641 [Adineta vaga]|nr:hypothetical protein I4U23_003641 [Adineta vaga]
MIQKEKRLLVANILGIFIDIFNLAEQLGIYFIAKDNDLEETAQQRFFFILFGVGGASTIEPLFLHPVAKIIFSICVESGELIAYLLLLKNTTNLLIVAILFFVLEVILHLICIFCEWNCGEKYSRKCPSVWCAFPLRIMLYGALFETQILFLFLDATSPFRGTFYEILMILGTFCGIPMVEKVVDKGCHFGDDDADDDGDKIYSVWVVVLMIISGILVLIVTITAVVYCAQLLPNRSEYKTYDFVIYIITITSYGSILFSLVCALGCTLCFCAGAFVKALKECLSK